LLAYENTYLDLKLIFFPHGLRCLQKLHHRICCRSREKKLFLLFN